MSEPVLSSEGTSENTSMITTAADSRMGKILHLSGWIAFVLGLILFFTFLKFPDEKIKNYIQGSLNAALSDRGYTLSQKESHLSFLFGVRYTLEGVTVYPPSNGTPVQIESVSVSPSVLGMMLGRMGGSFRIRNGDGELSGSFSTRLKSGLFDVSLSASKFDLGRLGLLRLLSETLTGAEITAGAKLTGDLSLAGDPAIPASLEGRVDLKLNGFLLDAQKFSAFPGAMPITLPRVAISESVFDFRIEKGKVQIKSVQLGKAPTDDIRATLTGDLELGRSAPSTKLNLGATFQLSSGVLADLKIIEELILKKAKKPDGSYYYKVGGTIANPDLDPPLPHMAF